MTCLDEITIGTLLAGRVDHLAAYFWGLSIIDYPRDKIHLRFLSNSDSEDFFLVLDSYLERLDGYASVELARATDIRPSTRAFKDQSKTLEQHARIISTLYNRLYDTIDTEWILWLEDDVIAAGNAIRDLRACFDAPEFENVGYACGTQMDRHGIGPIAWDLETLPTFGPNDSCKEVTFKMMEIRKPWGRREIGCGHFGLTMIRRQAAEAIRMELHEIIFRPRSSRPEANGLLGQDIIFCAELQVLGYARVCDYNVRALHMNDKGQIR